MTGVELILHSTGSRHLIGRTMDDLFVRSSLGGERFRVCELMYCERVVSEAAAYYSTYLVGVQEMKTRFWGALSAWRGVVLLTVR